MRGGGLFTDLCDRTICIIYKRIIYGRRIEGVIDWRDVNDGKDRKNMFIYFEFMLERDECCYFEVIKNYGSNDKDRL